MNEFDKHISYWLKKRAELFSSPYNKKNTRLKRLNILKTILTIKIEKELSAL